jgi:4-hydroxybenzoate polyprenyltransferase
MGSILSILWTVVVILVVLWILGLVLHIAGGFIHILLIIAAILVVYNLITHSRRGRTV